MADCTKLEQSQTQPKPPPPRNPEWNDEERHYYGAYLLTQQALVFITLGGIVVAIGGIVVAVCSLRSLNHNVRAANRQAAEASAQTTLMRQSQRPWVGLGAITILRPLRHKQALKIRATMQNGGKSPALCLRTRPVLDAGWSMPQDVRVPLSDKIPECEKPSPKWDKKMLGTMLLPGPPERSFIAETRILSDKEVDFLNRGAPLEGPPGSVFGLYLVGCIDYFDDSLKRPYRTYYCRFYLPPTKDAPDGYFADCARGNDVR